MQTIFSSGNLDIWNYYITDRLPKSMDVVIRTVIPVVEQSLTELLGTSKEFEREEGNISFDRNKDGSPKSMDVSLVYLANSLKVSSVPKEAIQQDESFIGSYLDRIQSLIFKPVHIDTETGKIKIGFSLEIGASV